MTLETLVAIFAVFSIADVTETYFFPRLGLKEGNPWLAKLMSQDGFDSLFFVKYVVFLGVFVAAGQGWVGSSALYAAVSIQLAVVLYNAYKMMKGGK